MEEGIGNSGQYVQEGSSGQSKKTVIAIGAVVVILILGVVLFMFMSGDDGSSSSGYGEEGNADIFSEESPSHGDSFDYANCNDLISKVKLQEIFSVSTMMYYTMGAVSEDNKRGITDVPDTLDSYGFKKMCGFMTDLSSEDDAIIGSITTECFPSGDERPVQRFEQMVETYKETDKANMGEETKEVGKRSIVINSGIGLFQFITSNKNCYVAVFADSIEEAKVIAKEIDKNIK